MGDTLRIGQVAARAGVGAKAIRFYEARGVLAPPVRAENGYRRYPPEIVDLLRFIKRAQGLGLTLDEIKEIIAIRRGGRPPCRHVRRLLQDKAREIEEKLEHLLELRRRIRRGLAACRRALTAKAVVCPHIEGPGGAGTSG